VAVVTGVYDGIEQCPLSVRTRQECIADGVQRVGVVDVVAGLVLLESGGELVGLVEIRLGGAGHVGHLTYLGRAGMA
jgi:hypothetical protein